MNLSPNYLIKLLEKNGYFYKRTSGSHFVYYNPATQKTAILKQAGIDDEG